MKKRILSVIAMLILSVYALQAQVDFGIVAGPNFQNMVGKDSEGDKITNGLLVGLHAGVKANIPFAQDFYFQTGLLFSQKGSMNNGGPLPTKSSGDYHTTTRLSYLELPLHLLFRPELGNGHVLVGFGPYIAYGITGGQKISYGNFSYDQKIKFTNEIELVDYITTEYAYYRGFDAGADVFAGYEFGFGLYLQLNAQLGMLNMMTNVLDYDSEPNLKNTGFSVSAGYNF